MNEKNQAKYAQTDLCPVRNIIARFGTKWAILLLMILQEQQRVRFSQLSKMLPDISSKVLSSTLRTLETDGLISRKIFLEVPPRVEYSLTAMGRSLVPHIAALTQWASEHTAQILRHRRAFERE